MKQNNSKSPFANLINYQTGVGVSANGTSQNYTLPFNILSSELRACPKQFKTPSTDDDATVMQGMLSACASFDICTT